MASDRSAPAIPTVSLADIAFLLLLFFLIGTPMGTEVGLAAMLPRATDGPRKPSPSARFCR